MFDDFACEIEKVDQDYFLLVDGERIAKRSVRTIDVAMNWIVLAPGWVLRDADGGRSIEATFEGATIH